MFAVTSSCPPKHQTRKHCEPGFPKKSPNPGSIEIHIKSLHHQSPPEHKKECNHDAARFSPTFLGQPGAESEKVPTCKGTHLQMRKLQKKLPIVSQIHSGQKCLNQDKSVKNGMKKTKQGIQSLNFLCYLHVLYCHCCLVCSVCCHFCSHSNAFIPKADKTRAVE